VYPAQYNTSTGCCAPVRRILGATEHRSWERDVMNTESAVTEAVVRSHLEAFLEQKGIAAILNDYADDARFYSEAKIYQGKQEIQGFFTEFIESLPAGGIDRFALRSLQVDGNVAYITWNVGSDIALGTDTFFVENGRIVAQTFAMYAG
jgi:ketosteroid isomerase-like protein